MEEFYEDIITYEELIFEYSGQKYVVTYYDNTLSVIEYNKPETEQFFTSPQEFAAKFTVGGTCFADLITKISVLVR